jgi:hypothetical protein
MEQMINWSTPLKMDDGIGTKAPKSCSATKNNNAKMVPASVLAQAAKERRFRVRRPVAGVKSSFSAKAGLPAFFTWRTPSIRWRERIHLHW